MGLTSALNTSLNGLALNEAALDVYGNNIANAGTNAFKASRIQFSTQLARTINYGSRPSGDSGGTNPIQIGLGATTAAITPDFSQGSVSSSANPSDLAIQGDGFFILNKVDPVYSRNGSFRLDSDKKLSNNEGLRVQGYGVDLDYNVVTTGLNDLTIRLGEERIAQATSKTVIGGALSPQGVVATRGTLQTSDALTDAGNGNAAITTATLLTNVRRVGAAIFTSGETLSFAPTRGGRTLEAKTLAVGAGTTVANLNTFLVDTLGIQSYTLPTAEPDGVAIGASVVGGQILIKGNRGTVNDFDIAVGSLTSNGATVPITFTPSTNRADGESTLTSFNVYDSLGTSLNVRMLAVMESQSANSTTYRYFLESPNQKLTATSSEIALGTNTINFDNVGHVTNPEAQSFNLVRTGASATDPLQFTVDFSGVSGISATGSNLNLTSQDGTSPGTLSSYVIDENGRINGAFDNGIVRTLGQVVLARFSNPAGLVQNGTDTYREGNSSGPPQKNTPGAGGAGKIRSGAIELSNTDISRSLVDLIVASTNYRGNARVISSVDQLVNELLALGRG